MFSPEAAVHRVRDRSNDVHTHTHTAALRSFLISCAASQQQRKGRDDVKMGHLSIRRGQEEGLQP